MLAKRLLEDDRADDRWLYETIRVLLDRAFRAEATAVEGRLAVVPSLVLLGRFEVQARLGGGSLDAWTTLFEMDELDFTFDAFRAALRRLAIEA